MFFSQISGLNRHNATTISSREWTTKVNDVPPKRAREFRSIMNVNCHLSKTKPVNSFLIRRFDKYGRNKCVYRDFQKSINSTWINIPGLTKTEFMKCPFRIVTTDITNFIFLSANIDATLNFQCFKRSSFYSEIFVICWMESVHPVADLCLTNQVEVEF